MHQDQIYIQYLKENDSQGIDQIYKTFSKNIVHLIVRNNGSEDDAYDILQESLVDIYHMAHNRDFRLTTKFSSFLALVCKRKWLNALKKRKQLEVTKSEDALLYIEDSSEADYNEVLLETEKENLIMQLLETMGESCQNIIRKCMKEKNHAKIAETLGISYAYLRKKKSECMAALVTKVRSSAFFKNL